MIGRYRRLAERLRSELDDLERETQRAQKSWQEARTSADPEPYLDSVALKLHAFYSGTERLFELIAAQVDEHVPESGAWHRELLDQMAQSMPEVRPSVINSDTAVALDEFRKFRHLVRNVYTDNLDPARMQNLLASLPGLWAQLKTQLTVFSDFLDQLSRADETPE